MNLPARICTVSWLLVGGLCAQVEAPAPPPERVVTVQITCTKKGTPVLRDAKAPVDNVAFQWVGHEVTWSVQGKACASLDLLGAELRRCYDDRNNWVPDPEHAGELMPMLVQIVAGPGVTFEDVAAAMDRVAMAKFYLWRLPGASARTWIVPMAPSVAVFGDGELILPAMRFQEPDEAPAGTWRPMFEVLQDGRVRFEGKIVLDPKTKPADQKALGDVFARLGIEARERKQTTKNKLDGREREVANAWLLIRADKWVEWRHVQVVLECATAAEPMFWKVNLQVAEAKDPEAVFVREHGGR
jgi:hypothetical protein